MAKLLFPYKNDRNQRYTKQLFWEQWVTMPIEMRSVEPPFTLNNPKEGYICFREEYVKDSDPTGYTTAKRIFGDYSYWEFLCGISWFKEAKQKWDVELDAKLQSEGMKKIRELAGGEDAKALAAARFLALLEHKKGKISVKRGRPSKEEIEGNLKAETQNRKEIDADAERIRLIVNAD